MTRAVRAAAVAVSMLAAACHHPAEEKARAIPAEIVAKIPADAVGLAGADLARARALGLDSWLGSLGGKGSDRVFAAWNGRDITFLQPGPGASSARAATELVDRAQSAAEGSSVWLVERGSGIPDLPGNAANVTRLLRGADWVTATVRGESSIVVEIAAECADEAAARRVEETARASFALAAAAEARRPEIAAVLRSIRIVRDKDTARLRLETDAAGLAAFAGVLR